MHRNDETKPSAAGRPVLIPAVAAALSCKGDPQAAAARRRERMLAELQKVFPRDRADAAGVLAGFGARKRLAE